MKRGKKLISMVLAVVLALSVMPMAFAAQECEHEFNTETLVRPGLYEKGYFICSLCDEKVYVGIADYRGFYMALCDFYTVAENIYNYEKPFDSDMMAYFEEKYNKIEEDADRSETGNLTEFEQEEVDALTARLQELVEEYEDYLSEIGAVKVVDVREYVYWCESVGGMKAYYDYTEEELRLVMENFSEEAQNKSFESRSATHAYLSEVRDNPEIASQEEFDKLAADSIAYIKAIYNCIENKHEFTKGTDNLDGTHSICCYYCTIPANEKAVHEWGEYISNNDATSTTDGTKTAKCTYCEATDTVADEGSKLDDDTTILINYLIEFIKLFVGIIKSLFIK